MKRRIKLGIIGTGIAAAKLHLPALKKLQEEFEIALVCNHTEPKAKSYSALVGDVPIVLDYKKALKNKNIEAVCIALPIDLNYKVTKDALKAGKHVIVEKPLAANLKDAKKMLSFEKKYKPVMMVAENFRYRNVYKKVKEIIDSDRIGRPYAFQWNVYYHNPADSEYGSIKWRQNNVYAGGFVTDSGVHNIAALRYFFGEIKLVNAVSECVNPSVGSLDTLCGLIEFESGVKGNLNLFFSAISHTENRILIFCEKGTIEVNDYVVQIKYKDASVESEDFGDDTGFYEEFRNFYYAITNGEKILGNFEEAYKDLEAILMLLQSSDTKKTVWLNK